MFVIVVCFLVSDRLQGDTKQHQEMIRSLISLILQVSVWKKQVQMLLLPSSLSFLIRKKRLFLHTARCMSIGSD